VPEPAFYAYARPEPPGLGDSAISPAGAYYERQLANFIFPYEAVRGASSPTWPCWSSIRARTTPAQTSPAGIAPRSTDRLPSGREVRPGGVTASTR